MQDATTPRSLPLSVGIGYKARHYTDLITDPGPVGWLEIHAENYMGDGGRPLAQLRNLSEKFPISVHGVGLSIGGQTALDVDHLARLKHLCRWLDPASFSEHLAWSTHETHFLNDLLPLPYTQASLAHVAAHIDQLQDTLGRQMLLENPSSYLAFETSEMQEVEFLRDLAKRTGCGLLLDVNNVFVSATNQHTDARSYINAFPLEAVQEIHLGGHDEDTDEYGAPLLIDSHGRAVVDPVWSLYAHTIARGGSRPTLIEWDNNVPDFAVLRAEVDRADTILTTVLA